MTRRANVLIRGKHKLWSFDVMVDDEEFDRMDADGLHIRWVENCIPAWGNHRLWTCLQDIWNFKNPFKE